MSTAPREIFSMRGRPLRPAFVLALFVISSLQAQTPAASRTKAHVEFLASDRLEGREAGTAGERLAGDYIAAQLAKFGAKPLPGHADMFVPFEFTAGSRDGGSRINGSACQRANLPRMPNGSHQGGRVALGL